MGGQNDQAAALCIPRFLARNKPPNLMSVLRGGTEDRRKSGAHKVCNSYKDRKCHCSVLIET